VRGVPITDAEGDLREWIGSFTDITERKRVEAAHREQARVATFGAEVGLALAQRDVLADTLPSGSGKETYTSLFPRPTSQSLYHRTAGSERR
jgi:hypothetical protein